MTLSLKVNPVIILDLGIEFLENSKELPHNNGWVTNSKSCTNI